MEEHNIIAATRETVRLIEATKRHGGDLASIAARLAEIRAEAAANAEASRGSGGGTIAVIPIHGFIEQRPSRFGMLFGATSISTLTSMFRRAMADKGVKAVVFDVSSGGGSVFGVTELAREIQAARTTKPIVSVVNSMAASAAYWLAASAHEVVCPPSGLCGSVGVYAIHEDYSGADAKAGIKTTIISAGDHKADAVEGAPLSDAGRGALQAMVNHIHSLFVADLASGRGVSEETVRSDFGRGLLMTAPQALKAGLIDRVGTLDKTLTLLGSEANRNAVMGRAKPIDDGEAMRRILEVRAMFPGKSWDEEAMRRQRAVEDLMRSMPRA